MSSFWHAALNKSYFSRVLYRNSCDSKHLLTLCSFSVAVIFLWSSYTSAALLDEIKMKTMREEVLVKGCCLIDDVWIGGSQYYLLTGSGVKVVKSAQVASTLRQLILFWQNVYPSLVVTKNASVVYKKGSSSLVKIKYLFPGLASLL